MILRWFVPFVLSLLLWILVAGLWLHDGRTIIGALVAFVGVCLVEEASA